MPYRVWDLLSEEEHRALLKRFKGFRSPPELGTHTTWDIEMESPEEIERIMKQRPRGSLGALGPGAGR
uniref:Uncharacterized protein n=1 Tax=viral metagenome TaxID=1070528 RepID=A0A6M3L845_9ZZZZ